MKKIAILLMLFMTNACYAMTSDVFDGMDANAVKAGLAKHILTKGGKVDHGESYDLNTFRASELVRTKQGYYNYVYGFNLVEVEGGTRLDLIVLKGLVGSTPANVSSTEEKEIMERLKSGLKGRFLYGLGFDFDYYHSKEGRIRAPKGKNSGIKLTTVKYDALKQGLQAGDIITAINGTALKDIPLKEYSTVLFAQKITDSITLTIKRGDKTFDVTLKPRLSNNKVF